MLVVFLHLEITYQIFRRDWGRYGAQNMSRYLTNLGHCCSTDLTIFAFFLLNISNEVNSIFIFKFPLGINILVKNVVSSALIDSDLCTSSVQTSYCILLAVFLPIIKTSV
jgi:hypothetical protein